MSVTIGQRKSRGKGGKLIYYYIDYGRGPGQRPSLDVFTYANPKNQVQKNHNKEALAILEMKRSQLVLDNQSVSTGYISAHRFRQNFLEYYQEYVDNNRKKKRRHLECSLLHFKSFLGKHFIAPIEITENLCERFRRFLLDRFNGETPANYFAEFKKVLKSATKDGYFRISPSEEVAAKSNMNFIRKANLEADEYVKLLKTPCLNQEVREAFIFSCYTGLRWCDVKTLDWVKYWNDELFIINQQKTGVELRVNLHPIAKAILEQRRGRLNANQQSGLVFNLPSHNMALRILDTWCKTARIKKHITWHCGRLSFSILLQDERVDIATVALLLGQTTTKCVERNYRRYRPKDPMETINKLPGAPTEQIARNRKIKN